MAARLDGELAGMSSVFGTSVFCTVDAIDGRILRGEIIAAQVPAYAIAELHTAAWVYGAVPAPPARLQLGVHADAKIRPFSTLEKVFREVVIDDDEIRRAGSTLVTSPLRTALDLARFCDDFEQPEHDIINFLAREFQFGLCDCVDVIETRRNLPYKNRALQRLQANPRWI